jgi:hypothetical protein
MLYTSDEDLLHLVRTFEDCTLPCADWTHPAHLTVCLWYVAHEWIGVQNTTNALSAMRRSINRYNPHCGAPTANDIPRERGYHETLTVFYVQAVARFYASYKAESKGEQALHIIANALCASDVATKDFPLRYYTRERLFSWEARQHRCEPDVSA